MMKKGEENLFYAAKRQPQSRKQSNVINSRGSLSFGKIFGIKTKYLSIGSSS